MGAKGFVKWPSQFWRQKVCIFCKTVVKSKEVDYGYRRNYVGASGHNEDEFACKECIIHLTEDQKDG